MEGIEISNLEGKKSKRAEERNTFYEQEIFSQKYLSDQLTSEIFSFSFSSPIPPVPFSFGEPPEEFNNPLTPGYSALLEETKLSELNELNMNSSRIYWRKGMTNL